MSGITVNKTLKLIKYRDSSKSRCVMVKNAIKRGKPRFITDIAVTFPFQSTGSKIRESLCFVLSIGVRTRGLDVNEKDLLEYVTVELEDKTPD